MDIKEVLRRENVGKKYKVKVKGRFVDYTLKLFGGEKLQLVVVNNYDKTIEDIMYLEDIVNGDFEEVVEIDWENIPIDTPIVVRDFDSESWMMRYFAFYKFGKVYCWFDSYTSNDNNCSGAKCWQQAKLKLE